MGVASGEQQGNSEMAEYFIFKKENNNFALPITSVLEIVEVDQIQDLGLELYGCIGGIVNREKIVPVFDSLELGLKKDNKSASIKNIIIAIFGDVTFGLTMDDFVGVDKISAGSDPTKAGEKREEENIVSAVVGYQKSTLIIFSPGTISKIVSAKIDDQSLKSESSERSLNSTGPEFPKQTSKQFICFSIENTNLAIPIEHVREVIEDYEVTPVFNVPMLLRGLINLRGNVIACLDISNEIGLRQRSLSAKTKYLIIRYSNSTIALCADAVDGIKYFYVNKIQESDSVLDEKQQKFAAGIYEDLEKTLLILSIAEIIETEQLLEYTELAKPLQ